MSETTGDRGKLEAFEVSDVRYEIRDGSNDLRFNMAREHGPTPAGNELGGRWVLRDTGGGMVDFDQYRHDLWGRHGIEPTRADIAPVAPAPRRRARAASVPAAQPAVEADCEEPEAPAFRR